MRTRNLQRSIDLAKDNYGIRNQFKLAAVMYYKNKVVSVGYNSYKTDPLQKIYSSKNGSVCLHAEIDCIKRALRLIDIDTLKKCTMVVGRVKKDKGELVSALARPCKGCYRAIVAFELGQCWFSTDDGFDRLL